MMVCFKNGSLAREVVRDQHANGSWDDFEALLAQSKAGNEGIVGFFFLEPEITPTTTHAGIVVFDDHDTQVPHDAMDASTVVRAIVESQCIAMRLHAERLGLGRVDRLLVTGGASASRGLLQVLADVFNCPTWHLESTTNSAALGAAFRAHHGWMAARTTSANEAASVPFDVADALMLQLVASPVAANASLYQDLLASGRFARLENAAVRTLARAL
ncbi:hypothetical protein PINS_up002426 [Pythium insidiosum]|nr:hypothetical protein PINS_up002426 [Pythium insidiosum]